MRVIDVGIDLSIRDQPPDHEATLTALFREHYLGLVRMALLIVGDQPTAEDVVQDAFAALHRRLDRLSDRDNTLPYIRAAVVNGCRTVLRRRGRPFHGQEPEAVWSAESAVFLGEDRREVLLALRTLPHRITPGERAGSSRWSRPPRWAYWSPAPPPCGIREPGGPTRMARRNLPRRRCRHPTCRPRRPRG